MHRRCQKLIGAAIPRDFPNRPLCLALTIKRVSAAAFLGIMLRSYPVLFTGQQIHRHYYFEALGKASGSQIFTKHWVLPKS